jgi:hypothetical protein
MKQIAYVPVKVVDPQTGEEVELRVGFRTYEGESEHAFMTRKNRGIDALKDFIKHKGEIPK